MNNSTHQAAHLRLLALAGLMSCCIGCQQPERTDVVTSYAVALGADDELLLFKHEAFLELGYDCTFMDNLESFRHPYTALIDEARKGESKGIRYIYVDLVECVDASEIGRFKALNESIFGVDNVKVTTEEFLVVVEVAAASKT